MSKTRSVKAASANKKSKSSSLNAKTNSSQLTSRAAKKRPAAKKTRLLTKAYLRNLNLAVALISVAEAVLLAVYAKAHSFSVSSSYLTLDPLKTQTSGQPVLVTATRQVFDINLVYLAVACFGVAAIVHLAVSTVLRDRYEAGLERKLNSYRWWGYAATTSLLLVIVALLVGVSDLMILGSIVAATIVGNLFSLLIETHEASAPISKNLKYGIAGLSFLLPWAIIGLYVLNHRVYGDGRLGHYVYYVAASLLALNVLSMLNMMLAMKKAATNYLVTERNYLILSFLANAAVVWLAYAGLLRH